MRTDLLSAAWGKIGIFVHIAIPYIRRGYHLLETSWQAELIAFLLITPLFIWVFYGDMLWAPSFFFVPSGQEDTSTIKVYDERSRHECLIEPFSQTVARGGVVHYQIVLTPSAPGKSYELVVGSLPLGMTASLYSEAGRAPQNVTLSLRAADDAQAGSLNSVIIYYEPSEDGEKLPNFCQLNLIIE